MNGLLSQYKRIIAGEIAPSPVELLMGIRPLDIEEGRSVFELEATYDHSNPQGTVNGGVTTTLADMAMGMAFGTTLQPHETFTTIELKINFLKPIWLGKVRAEAEVKKRGKTIGLVECNLFDEKGSLVAFSTSTCMVLEGEKASGRSQHTADDTR
ncbi:PaaI family thioesterase [Paenibacillus azoreducens]|uniref:Thioesterase n=1 Tax=Paenibacillus azoreducens TaxID=116718 RepID=A0A919YCA8_9BACL|nr:PaaI family thioesterase [Paenibacillus azoreducens]GIO46185.1 thioesterase [Paenibacillus azoreducens]